MSSGIPGTIVDNESTHTSLRASIVVCVYTEERWRLINLALDSLSKQTVPPWQVIVVSDYNPALLKRLEVEYPDLDVIPNEFERGLSGARNSGVHHAVGDIVVFLDDDARAEPSWLEMLLASYEDESVLGAGGQVLADWDSLGKPGWFPDSFLWVVGCSYEGLPKTKADIRNPVGANMSFRKSAFDKVGLFDHSMGRNSATGLQGCEETEFSIRLLGNSPDGRIIYEPRAVVHHYVQPTRGTWRYFMRRCYDEGYSKEQVAQLSGMTAALSSERQYVVHTLRRAAYRELGTLLRRGSADALGRLTALILGVSCAAAGYARSVAVRNLSPLRLKRRSP
jgi:glucosyl-dolichyl phosphate glucuronosyltransferase